MIYHITIDSTLPTDNWIQTYDMTDTWAQFRMCGTVGPSGIMLHRYLLTCGDGDMTSDVMSEFLGRNINGVEATIDRLERFGLVARYGTDVLVVIRHVRKPASHCDPATIGRPK